MKKLAKVLLRVILLLFLLVNFITAFHAYKFTHFYNAGDASVKAKEDKHTGDIIKEIFFGINMGKKPNPVLTLPNLTDVVLTTKDSLHIRSWYFKTPLAAKGTVILFHGHGGFKAGVLAESDAFQQMGYNTLLIDFRAHGNSDGNQCTIGYYEAEEVKLAYDFIKQKGDEHIILWGISMGAAAITKAMSEYALQPDKIILEMPFGSINEAAGGRIQSMGVPRQPLATFIVFWGGVENGFWAFNMKPTEFAKKITIPTLLQWGKHDIRVSEKETTDIYNNLNCPKKLVVYDNSGHESLCKNEHAKWMETVGNFLQLK